MSYIGTHKITLDQFKDFNQELLTVLNGAVLRSGPISASIPTTGWMEDAGETSSYKYHYDLSVSGLTAAEVACVSIAYSSLGTAADCGLSPKNETMAGYIRFRAVSVPEAVIAITYWIESALTITTAENEEAES